MDLGWKGILPISLANLFCVAVGLALGYIAGLIAFGVVAFIALVVVANLPSTKRFTRKTRIENRVLLNHDAVPYGGQSSAVQESGK
jgi:hypothetical protein